MLKHGQLTFISFSHNASTSKKTLLSSVNFLQDKPAYLTVMLAFGISCKSTSQAFLCSTQSSIEETTSQPSHAQLTVALEGGFESSGSLHCFCAVQLLSQHSAVQKRTFWQRWETRSARAVRCWSPIQLQRR